MTFEAYRIGIRISLINHVNMGLAAMGRDFMHTEAQAAKLQAQIKGIQNMALKGTIMFGVGAAGLMLLKGPYEEAKKLAQAQANFATLNLSAADNSTVFAKAATMSHKILGTSITDNVKLIHDLHTAFGDLHHAIGSADMFAKMSFVAGIANGGKQVDGLTNAAAKALEHRGGKVMNNPAEFAAEGDLMTKVLLATKMRVGPKDFLTASGTGKMAYQLYDKEYLYGNFAGLMSINGGARTGTEGMTAFSSLIGGHMDSKGKGFLADLGLWQEGFSKKRLGIMHTALQGLTPDERRVAVKSMGGQAVVAGGLKDADAELFAHRPDLFIQKIVPLVRKRFGLDMTDEQVALVIAKNLNRSTGNFLGTQVTMAPKLSKDTAIINRTMGNESGYQNYIKSPLGAEAAAGKAWENFLTVFGTVYLPVITSGLLKLAGALDSMSQWVDRNQGLVKALVYAFAALAGGLVMRGTVLLLSAAFRGLGLALLMRSIGGAAGIVGVAGKLRAVAAGLGVVGKASLALAALWGAYQIYQLAQAATDLYSAKNREGVKLAPGAQARIEAGETGLKIVGSRSQREYWASMGMAVPGINRPWSDAKIATPALAGEVATTPATAAKSPMGPWRIGQSQYVAPAAAQDGKMINNTIVMPNGEVLARVVTKEQSKAISRPPAGMSTFDGSMQLSPVGAS